MRKIILPLSIIASFSILFISCQQELEEIPEIQERCRITTGYYYGGSGGLNDSTVFTYDGNKVIRADAYDSYVTYSYTGNNITGRKIFYNPNNELSQVDTIQYNSDNRIMKMTSWYYDDPFWFDTARVTLVFYYSGTRLDKVVETSDVFTPLGLESDTLENIFTTNAAGNIEKIVFADSFGAFDSIGYAYNTDLNYFNIAHPHFFLFDPYFQLHAGFIPHLPYFYSKHNVNKFIIYGNWEYDISYGLDSLNKVTSVNMDGDDYMKYRYQCD